MRQRLEARLHQFSGAFFRKRALGYRPRAGEAANQLSSTQKHLSVDSIDIFTRLVANQSSDQLNLGTITASSP
jgi:hypothetical protein